MNQIIQRWNNQTHLCLPVGTLLIGAVFCGLVGIAIFLIVKTLTRD